MELEIVKKRLTNCKEELKRQFGIRSVRIFGSYARKEQKKGSDLDVLAEFAKVPSLFTLLRAERYLSEKLGLKVDLCNSAGLKQSFKSTILPESVMV